MSLMICFLKKITLSIDAKLEIMNESDNHYSDVAKKVLLELRTKLLDRFDVSNENLVSALLDPVIKNAPWLDEYLPEDLNGNNESRNQLLKQCLKDFEILSDETPELEKESNANHQTKRLNNVLKSRMALFNDLGLSIPSQKRSSIDQEITEYLAIEVSDFSDSPINWWECNQNKFPNLKQLFEAFLSASPSSASSERVFSKAGKFLSADRSNLCPFNLNMLCFINANVNYLEENGDIFITTKITDL